MLSPFTSRGRWHPAPVNLKDVKLTERQEPQWQRDRETECRRQPGAETWDPNFIPRSSTDAGKKRNAVT